MEEIIKILGIALTSSVKFLPTPFMASAAGFSFWKSVWVTTSGGILGVLVFFYSSNYFMQRAARRRKPDKKTFTRFNKLAVWIKRRVGVWGIALFTPPVFSIPVGTIICVKFFGGTTTTLLVLLGSVVFWSLVLTAFASGLF